MWDVLIDLGELFSLLLGTIGRTIGETLFPFVRFVVLESWDVAYNTIFKGIVTISDSRFSYINLLSSLGIALVIYALWARRKNKTLSLRGAFRFIFPKRIWQHPFAWLDARYACMGLLIRGLITMPIAVYAGVQTFLWAQDGFSTLMPTPLFPVADLGFLTLCLIALFALLAADFCGYATHWLQHKIPFLWEFHKIHHSALVLTPFTTFREHFIDNLFYTPLASMATACHGAFFAALIGYQPEAPTVLGINIFLFLFNFVGYNLRHSHIWLAIKPYWLGYVISTPAHHQFHHSKEAQHLDKNFGTMVALWDWIFGTLYLPRERETFRLGLTDNSEQDYNTVWRIIWVPFAKAFKLVPQNLETNPKTQQHPAE